MVLQFNPSSDSTTHSFGFNMYHPTDGGVRIVAGKLSFAGRYITNIEIKFSVAGSSYTDLGASYINVVKIVGYK